MKLLSEFERQSDRLRQSAPLSHVWMTSFNLNIPFIEKYLLPRILEGSSEPVTRMDYELLQERLASSGTDVRIFCDHRLAGSEQTKRTAVPVHPVSPLQLLSRQPAVSDSAIRVDTRTLFHPKVILLRNQRGEMILGSGSANLTLSGWGRNQEAFRFCPVTTRSQHQAILDFFAPLSTLLEADAEGLPASCRLLKGDTRWRFVHSFQSEPFLSTLFKGMRGAQLSVWSPYLQGDPERLCQQLTAASHPSLTVKLVSDPVAGGGYRMPWSDSLQQLLQNGKLQFCHNPQPEEQCEMVHAKLWHLQQADRARLATGSWNFTTGGTERNIEAGIIEPVPAELIITGEPLTVSAADFASEALLESLQPDWPEAPPFALQVHWDWARSEYRLSGQWFCGQPEEGYRLTLPGLSRSLRLEWATRRSTDKQTQVKAFRLIAPASPLFVASNDALLNEHCWQVRKGRAQPFSGIIVESSQSCRPARGYASLSDLLQDLLLGRDPQQSDALVLRGEAESGQQEESPPLLVPGESAPDSTLPVSWHALFYVFSGLQRQLRNAASSAEFHQLLFGYPGGVAELADFARRPEPGNSDLFYWFLSQEINALATTAEQLAASWPDLPAPLPWQRLKVAQPKTPVTVSPKYLRWIRQRCGYEQQ